METNSLITSNSAWSPQINNWRVSVKSIYSPKAKGNHSDYLLCFLIDYWCSSQMSLNCSATGLTKRITVFNKLILSGHISSAITIKQENICFANKWAIWKLTHFHLLFLLILIFYFCEELHYGEIFCSKFSKFLTVALLWVGNVVTHAECGDVGILYSFSTAAVSLHDEHNALPSKCDNRISHMLLYLKSAIVRTSLAVRWLRLHLPMQAVRVRSLVGEVRTHMPHGQKNQNIKQKQCCNKFNKDFKKWSTLKKKKS